MFKQTQLLALAFFLLSTSGIIAQNAKPAQALVNQARHQNISFPAVHLFQTTDPLNASAARFAQQAQFLLLQADQLKELLAAQPQAISLVLPYNGQLLTIDLVRAEMGTSALHVYSSGASESTFSVKAGLHYRGALQGSPESIAAFSFFDEELFGLVSDARFNNLVLGRMQVQGNTKGYMLYSDLELAMDNPFDCVLLEHQANQNTGIQTKARQEPVRPVRIALEAGYALVQNRGSRQATVHYLSALFNQLTTVFAQEGIELALSRINIPSTPQYDHSTSGASVLKQLVENQTNRDFDLIQLIGLTQTNPESAGYINGLCTPEFGAAYCAIEPAFSQVPTHSWALSNMAHELGHQFGARHTQWCGWPGGAIESCSSGLEGDCSFSKTISGQKSSTLMSYCLLDGAPALLAAGLGRLPGQLIRENIGKASCLQAPETVLSDGNFSLTESNSFALIPNPAQQQVQVHIKQSATRLVVLDVFGRLVLTSTMSQQQSTVLLDLSGMATGLYFVQLFDGETLLATRRLIKE